MKVLKRTSIKNQKGFTLIELLAVITILALLMLLASGSVISMLNNATKSAFALDGQNVVEQAKMTYTDALLNDNLVGSHFCMSVTYLKQHGLTKDKAEFNGSVEIKIEGDVATYTLWLTDGARRFNGVERANLNKDNVEDSAEAVSVNCNKQGTLIG